MSLNLENIYFLLFNYYGPQNWWPADSQDEIIIGAILTQNTNWKNVELAIKNLKKHQVCSLKHIEISSESLIADLIKPSGFFNIKCKRLKHTASILNKIDCNDYSDNELRQLLLSINGIGPETADSILLYAYKRLFFVIDAYTKRSLNRLGFSLKDTTYQGFQDFIMANLKKDYILFNEFHALIVANAKIACKVKPACFKCPLIKICNYGRNYESTNSKS